MQSLGAKVFLLACVLAIATSDKKVVDSDKNVADSDKKVVDWEDSTLTFRK